MQTSLDRTAHGALLEMYFLVTGQVSLMITGYKENRERKESVRIFGSKIVAIFTLPSVRELFLIILYNIERLMKAAIKSRAQCRPDRVQR